MAYQYGVSTRELATSVQAGRSASSALPCVVGFAPWWTAESPMSQEEALKPRLVRNFAQYQELYGPADDIRADGWARYSLDSWARAWWLYGGQGEAFIWNVAAMDEQEGTHTISGLEESALKAAIEHEFVSIVRIHESDAITDVAEEYYSTSIGEDGGLVVSLSADYVGSWADCTIYYTYLTPPATMLVDDITEALGRTWEIFQSFLRAPTMLLAPYHSCDSRVAAALKAATSDVGDGRLAMAYLDIPSRDFTTYGTLGGSVTPDDHTGIISSGDVLGAKPLSDSRVVAIWGTGCIGPERFEGSCIFAAERAKTDAETGFAYISPCNRPLPISAVVAETGGVERALRVQRQQLNDDVVANGVVGFLPTEAGWVLWGEQTTAAPASTDVKDIFHSTRGMMDYLRNDFLGALAGRISLPIVTRQVQGVLKSYTDRLGFFVGSGAIVAGSIELDTELTTATELLQGHLHFKLMVAPPPPIVAIIGVFEYDVESFTAIITGG